MGRICQKCHKTYSSRESLWNHKKYCKGGAKHHSFQSQDSIVGYQNTCSVPYKPETVMDKDIKQQYVGSDKIQNLTRAFRLTQSLIIIHLPAWCDGSPVPLIKNFS